MLANDEKKEEIKVISDVFLDTYEKIKINLGIDVNAKTPENSFSDEVFLKLNPKLNVKLSHII